MLKLSKLTDYGIVLMGYMAKSHGESRAARELSEMSGLPLPTVSKCLSPCREGDYWCPTVENGAAILWR